MSLHLIGEDILLHRKRYDEALSQQGIPCKYQWPNMANSNNQSEPVIDSYSDMLDIHIFYEGNPKIKTIKRFGWIIENHQDLPMLIHCSWNLPNLQKDSLFHMSGLYSGLPDRVFRVTEIAYDVVAPDHLVCQVVPAYEKQTVGKTDKEVSAKFNKSNTFLRPNTNYRGESYTTAEDGVKR